jgi:uncharacterized Ntn-hydrolase superfamily protein
MTFTVVARCRRTHMLGVAMATRALAVGNRCPVVRPRMGAASVQAIADPRLTLQCGKLIDLGLQAGEIVTQMERSDPERGLRQVGVVDAWGNAAAFTGAENGNYAGHIIGRGWLVMGNGVISAAVVEAMARAMESSEDEVLEERMMRAVEAGGAAGGQAEGQNSASILQYGDEPFSYLDLRVDIHDEPIREMRRIFERFRPLLPYFAERPYNPRIARDDRWLHVQSQA